MPRYPSCSVNTSSCTGDNGTGYYLDTPLSRPPEPEKPQKKGVLPKSKPIVPGLKVAGGVAKRSKDGESGIAELKPLL